MKNRTSDYLVKALLALENEDECLALLKDLCTVTEIHSMGQRLEVAQRLINGEVYTDIVSATGASTATISRVNRALNDGSGYKTVITRLENKGGENK